MPMQCSKPPSRVYRFEARSRQEMEFLYAPCAYLTLDAETLALIERGRRALRAAASKLHDGELYPEVRFRSDAALWAYNTGSSPSGFASTVEMEAAKPADCEYPTLCFDEDDLTLESLERRDDVDWFTEPVPYRVLLGQDAPEKI